MPKKVEPIIEEEEDLAKEDYEEDKSWEKAFDDTEDDETREDSSYHCNSVNFSERDRLSVDTL